ncbi:MAG TPA: histidinol dehydrogenase [Solirubrobacteraceae bacterium]|jgi:histidinol dehydrogenase|nr:histidinol dehydrogenase [Solirubrobacteraceae bacterium]
MDVLRLAGADVAALGGPVAAAARIRELAPAGESVAAATAEIIAAVRERGDAALLELTRRFDTAGRDPAPLVVEPERLDDAIREMPLELVAGLQVAISNVAQAADASLAGAQEPAIELPQGQTLRLRELPVASAAVYVPGGRAPYPSTVVMGVVTARAAGVIDVAVCSPPGPDGEIDPVVLGTCRLCGVERIYRMGGAQAVAALAYGTETVAPVETIVGPGNLYVQEAKRQLSGVVGIEGFAGPSDLLVVLGAACGAGEVRLAALDMLAQAEHGAGSLVAAVSPSAELCERLAATLGELVVERPTVGDAAFAIAEVADPAEALALANAFAAEHLELIGEDVEQLSASVRSAGALFVGASSATAFGDYVAGSNHILPTAGAARFSSGLTPRHFRRRMTEVRIGPAAAKLAAAGAPIARAEGFEVHAESMEARRPAGSAGRPSPKDIGENGPS